MTQADGTTIRYRMPERFILNNTRWLIHPDDLETLMQAWERSPKPPAKSHVLTEFGYERARQQLLLERLRAKREAAQS